MMPGRRAPAAASAPSARSACCSPSPPAAATGRGQLVEVAAAGGAVAHADRADRRVQLRRRRHAAAWATATRSASTAAPTATSACNILTQGHWTGLCRLMGRDDLVDHPRYRTGVERADPAVAAELDAIIADWAAHAAGRRHVPRRPGDCAARSRSCPARWRCWRPRSTRRATSGSTDDDPERGPLRLPGRRRSSWRPARFAPFRPATTIGADAPRSLPRDRAPPPLDGVRVLDLTAWQAGPAGRDDRSATSAPT